MESRFNEQHLSIAPSGRIDQRPAPRSSRGTDCFALDDDTAESLKNPAGTRSFAGGMEALRCPGSGKL